MSKILSSAISDICVRLINDISKSFEMQDPGYIYHNDKKIVLNDYSGGKCDDLRRMIDKMMEFNVKEKDMLLLVDLTGTIANNDVTERFKTAAEEVKGISRKVAVVGIKGIQKILFNAVVRFSKLDAKLFDSRQEALDWLIQ